MDDYTKGMLFRDFEQALVLTQPTKEHIENMSGIKGKSRYFEIDFGALLKTAHKASCIKIISESSDVIYNGIMGGDEIDPLGICDYFESLGSHSIKPAVEAKEKDVMAVLEEYQTELATAKGAEKARQNKWYKKYIDSRPTKEYTSEKARILKEYTDLLALRQSELTELLKNASFSTGSMANNINVEIIYLPSTGFLTDGHPLGIASTTMSAVVTPGAAFEQDVIKHPLIKGLIEHPDQVTVNLDNMILKGRGSQFELYILDGTDVHEKALESLENLEFFKDIAD